MLHHMFSATFRRRFAVIALFVTLFANGMMSAFACMGSQSGTLEMRPAMACCTALDAAVASLLCKQHCQSEQQSVDAPNAPVVADAVALFAAPAFVLPISQALHIAQPARSMVGYAPPLLRSTARLRI